jgi:hypothetical protein
MTDEEMKAALGAKYGDVLTTEEMRAKYDVVGFGGGLCVVERKSDGKRGSLNFSHLPRFYYDFQEH